MTRRVAVIGGGPAGCAAAYELAKRGAEVTLFEAAAQVGGRTRTSRAHDAIVDTGAGFFTSFYPRLHAYARALDLPVVPLSRTNVLVHRGVAQDFTLGSIRSFTALAHVSSFAKLRMLTATLRSMLRHRGVDLADPAALAPLDRASIASHARATIGEDGYQFLIRPGIEPFWYFSCEEVSCALYLPLQAHAADAKFFTLRDGMDTLCRALVREVGVRTSAPVQAIERRGQRVQVACDDGGGVFDAVIVATTATAALAIADRAIDAPQRGFLSSQRYVPNVHVLFRVPVRDCPPASAAFACGPGEHPIAALSFNRHKGQGTTSDFEVVSVFLSARESELLLDVADDAEVAAHAWSRARASWPVLPREAEALEIVRRPEAIPVHEVGRFSRAATFPNDATVAFAGDYLAVATIEGALASGQRAARAITGSAAASSLRARSTTRRSSRSTP